jgi:diguanylate cyclase (GGDEF)-like protein
MPFTGCSATLSLTKELTYFDALPNNFHLEAGWLMQEHSNTETAKSHAGHFLWRLLIVCLIAFLYYVAGRFGLGLAFVNPSATAVWPPTGIALAAFLVLGEYVAPGILVGAFLVNLTTSDSVLFSLAVAIGNTLEGLIAARLVNRFASGRQAFDKAPDVFKFAFLASLLSPAVSATIGVTSLVWIGLARPEDYFGIWLTWWLGDAAGALIVAPALILWAVEPKNRWSVSRTVEAAFLLATLILVSLAVFGDQSSFAIRNYPLEFLLVPVLIWAAYRFGQRETATITVVLSAFAITGTLQGLGPFARGLPNESLLLLQSFMITAAITGLGLTALVSERRAAESELITANQKLELSRDELEEHNRKMFLLNQMGDLLQSCSTVEEAYTIIGPLGQQLFPEETGALYIINNSRDLLEAATAWGPLPAEQDTFALDDCWALRLGRIHIYKTDNDIVNLLCPHLKNQLPVFSLCIPMTAHGDTMGIFHLRGYNGPEQTRKKQLSLTEAKQQLALAMADNVVLALANLKLRISLRDQAIRDPLTGLFNRRYLEETLEREFNRALRMKRSVGVIMLDLDHFKKFNDTFGHEAGDVLLRKLGNFLKQHLRGGDIACRYGGEEFALILPEVSPGHLLRRAEQLREGVKQLSIAYQGQDLGTLTMSLGIAMCPIHGATGQRVLNAADAALYEAKRAGRDRVVIASSDDAEEVQASS